MKKVLAVILACLLLLSSVACSGQESENTTPSRDEQNSQSNQNNQKDPTEDSDDQPEQGQQTQPPELKVSEGLGFELNSDGESYSLTWVGTCKDAVVVIPATYEGKPVTAIGTSAFSLCRWITHVYIPEGVATIGDFALSECDSLVYVDIPDSVVEIGVCAFARNPALESIVLPPNVKELDKTFYKCTSLAQVTLPENLVSMVDEVFGGCDALTAIEIPASVALVESHAMGPAVTSVTFKGYGNWYIYDYKYVKYQLSDPAQMAEFFTKNVHFTLTSLYYTDEYGVVYTLGGHQDTHFYAMVQQTSDKSLMEYTIPAQIHDVPVEQISSNAFADCTSLTSLYIPASVVFIGSDSVKNCTALTRVTFERTGDWQDKKSNALDLTDPAENVNILNAGYLEIPNEKR